MFVLRFYRPPAQSTTAVVDFEEALAGFRDDVTLARATVVWKKGNGSGRERLLLVRSCARLGRAEMVLELLQHNPRTELLCEQIFLDAVYGNKASVSFQPFESGCWFAVCRVRHVV